MRDTIPRSACRPSISLPGLSEATIRRLTSANDPTHNTPDSLPWSARLARIPSRPPDGHRAHRSPGHGGGGGGSHGRRPVSAGRCSVVGRGDRRVQGVAREGGVSFLYQPPPPGAPSPSGISSLSSYMKNSSKPVKLGKQLLSLRNPRFGRIRHILAPFAMCLYAIVFCVFLLVWCYCA